jgi:hypothetical protein
MLDRQAHQFAAGGQRGAGPRSGLHFLQQRGDGETGRRTRFGLGRT